MTARFHKELLQRLSKSLLSCLNLVLVELMRIVWTNQTRSLFNNCYVR